MEKYYYECPIKAAYMTHAFGITTYVELAINGEVFDTYHIKDWNNRELRFNEKKHYISDESKHIFEPKDWDLKNEQTGEIIMRDGKHFFMPKVELNK